MKTEKKIAKMMPTLKHSKNTHQKEMCGEHYRKMQGNKRGFTYLLVTSFMIVVILILFFSENRYSYQDREEMEQVRIRAMNDFIRNLNTDIHRASYISSFRAMLALEDYVTRTTYLVNINESFKETFFYGTINSTNSTLMENSSFSGYLGRVQQLAGQIGITLDINVTDIRIKQSSPWIIDVYIMMNITASDDRNTASWHILTEYVTAIPIDNLRDPLYSKNTFNRVPNTIRRLDSTVLVNGTDVTQLRKHVGDSYYIASPSAPNFVMRFEGKTDADISGIESIVNISEILAASEEGDLYYDEDAVKVDYIYFNRLTTDKVCDVEYMSGYHFVIPSDRVSLYQIDTLNYSVSCP
ncbi:MAG: hypothetical protein ACP5OA_04355 [Candidatus Woesearchaeota archaeon]